MTDTRIERAIERLDRLMREGHVTVPYAMAKVSDVLNILLEPAPSPVVMLSERWPKPEEYPVIPGYHKSAGWAWVACMTTYVSNERELQTAIDECPWKTTTPVNAFISIAEANR